MIKQTLIVFFLIFHIQSAFAVSLASITATSFNTRGNSVLAKTLGAGVSFSSFSNDPTFVARTPTSTADPSPADVILDTLGERASAGTTSLSALLVERSTSTNVLVVPFMEEDEFAVDLSANLVKVGQNSGTNLKSLIATLTTTVTPVTPVTPVFDIAAELAKPGATVDSVMKGAIAAGLDANKIAADFKAADSTLTANAIVFAMVTAGMNADKTLAAVTKNFPKADATTLAITLVEAKINYNARVATEDRVDAGDTSKARQSFNTATSNGGNPIPTSVFAQLLEDLNSPS